VVRPGGRYNDLQQCGGLRAGHPPPGPVPPGRPCDLSVGTARWPARGGLAPRAAKQGTWAVAQVTPPERAERLALLGHMPPLKRTRDRVAKAGRFPWEAPRPPCEDAGRQPETVPPEAVALAVSLDGGLPRGTRARARPRAQPLGPKGSRPGGQAIRQWAVPPCRMMTAWASVG
jgi:hypothetical protein